MRRHRITAAPGAPRGLSLGVTLPAFVPAPAPAPQDCPCGPIGLVVFNKDAQESGTSIAMFRSTGDYLRVHVAGKMPDDSYADFIDVSWAPTDSAAAPTAFMFDAGSSLGIPFYVGAIDAAGTEQGAGVLTFRVQATCGTGETLTTAQYTVTVNE